MPTQKWREANLERMRAYRRKWYAENKEKAKEKVRDYKKSKIDWLTEIKESRGCSQCDETHPACLEFHHRDPSEKEFNISNAVMMGFSREKILVEIAKCELLCANCHRKVHY